MSSSDSGSPTAARMLISLQRLEGEGRLAAAAFSTSGAGGDGGCAATATACGLGLAFGRVAAAGADADLGSASVGFTGAAGGVGVDSRGTAAERQGVRHGLVSATAGKAAQHSAITIAIGAMTENGEDRAW
ncbi:hypothetical protein ASC78_22040 [Variovorax sp. Root318D1]|uniref:hypothetical protein n=1 Tax=Variovorax sp. Root318D1 TaxID=1736513 RepID=UPI0006F75B4E|nr:hypothetical protein [Variovorax sp. Root318D1]KQU89346.1 hypothetical protein ASC78_22040 [Variovorax sp. Root318D1]